MAVLWALLPALCVIIGYLASSSINPLASLILVSLSGGVFIYIGSYEILSAEFKHGGGSPPVQSHETSSNWGD
eukprot:scaffold432855_cov53-Prasinocladus_malaysianus.AAC.1